jgi:GTP:adenosylcobinamide-phosphate guanylyltransferase
VLAGKRGPTDPLAQAAGTSHRALVAVGGMSMVERVVETLGSAGIARVTVSIDDPDVLAGLPRLRPLLERGSLVVRESRESPAASVADFLADRSAAALPCLVTTADHPLLTAAMLERFWTDAAASGADLAVGVVPEPVFRARYPGMRRTFVRLRDDAFSGANLFAFLQPPAAAVADFWRRMERHRKNPWRMARVFGIGSLAKFAAGRLTVGDALERVRRLAGARVALVRLPFAEAAVDVDREADLQLARSLLGDASALRVS